MDINKFLQLQLTLETSQNHRFWSEHMGAMLLCSQDNKLWPIYVAIVKVTIIYWKSPCLIPFSFRMISS